jgi:hypothetical protein
MGDTNASGCGVASAGRARRYSRCGELGWLLPGTTAEGEICTKTTPAENNMERFTIYNLLRKAVIPIPLLSISQPTPRCAYLFTPGRQCFLNGFSAKTSIGE